MCHRCSKSIALPREVSRQRSCTRSSWACVTVCGNQMLAAPAFASPRRGCASPPSCPNIISSCQANHLGPPTLNPEHRSYCKQPKARESKGVKGSPRKPRNTEAKEPRDARGSPRSHGAKKTEAKETKETGEPCFKAIQCGPTRETEAEANCDLREAQDVASETEYSSVLQ